jgi:hypothetical protein
MEQDRGNIIRFPIERRRPGLEKSSQAKLQEESAEGNPHTPLRKEQQDGGKQEISHEHLVSDIRKFITQEQWARREKRKEAYPEGIIRDELSSLQSVKAGQGEERSISPVWYPLRNAWDALTYDRYQSGSFHERLAGRCLSEYFQCTHEPVIRLSDTQVRILDALTEAVGIQHQRGQAEIEIPEKLRNYDQWISSEEYQGRLAKVVSEWEQRVKNIFLRRNK